MTKNTTQILLGVVFSFAALNAFASLDKAELLERAAHDLMADAQELKETLGIRFYHPYALPQNERFLGSKERLYMTAEHCPEEASYSSSEILSRDIIINPVHEIPGHTDYEENNVYKKGDLQHALFGNVALMTRLMERAKDNALYCTDKKSDNAQSRWSDILLYLRTKAPQPL